MKKMERILVIAPHKDDETLGVGGTMIKKIEAGCEVCVCIVTSGKAPIFVEDDIGTNEAKRAHKMMGIKRAFFLDYPAAMLETVPRYELNARLIDIVKDIEPNEVYIPHIGDMQKDHQIVAHAAMVACRPKYSFAPKRIFAYETLSETGWNIPNIQNEFIPNVFVDIAQCLDKKIEALKCYKSQLGIFPDARSIEAVEALAKYRGALMSMEAAEAFMLIREIL